jgi:NADH:ubiquinone oxidoreductase subunit F (NADH-binding)
VTVPTLTRRLLEPSIVDGARPTRDPRSIVDAVRLAGLTGRGGAGFPTWRKLAAVAATGRRAVVVANGAESEPASAKDRTLLTRHPQLVLDGLAYAAKAVGADQTHLYVPAALADQLRALPVRVHVAPELFVAGEESAVVAAVNGRRPLPRDKVIRVTQAGVDGRPTLVQNVETLAHLGLIARYGPEWFRREGTADEPGTFLATVDGVVSEFAYGVRLGEIIDLTRVHAVLIGGFHGAWVPADPSIVVSRAGLAQHGTSPGAGVMLSLPLGACGLAETARLAGYLAGQTAGQCGPCVNGLPRLADSLGALAAGVNHPVLPAEISRLTAIVTGRGACRHPDGTVRLIRSALTLFASDIDAHQRGRCLYR